MGEGNPSIQAVVTTFPQTFKVANFGGNGAHKIGLNLPLMYFHIMMNMTGFMMKKLVF